MTVHQRLPELQPEALSEETCKPDTCSASGLLCCKVIHLLKHLQQSAKTATFVGLR